MKVKEKVMKIITIEGKKLKLEVTEDDNGAMNLNVLHDDDFELYHLYEIATDGTMMIIENN